MNIKMQCCGLAILFVIACLYNRKQKLHIHTKKVFFGIFSITAISLTMDILSLVAIQFMNALPIVTVHLICKIYNITLLLVGTSGFIYVCADAYIDRIYNKICHVCLAVVIVEGLVVLLTPIECITDEAGNGLYTYGPCLIFTYIFGIISVLSTFFVLLRKKSRINPSRFKAVILWFSIWLGASLVQIVFKELLLVGFASAIGVLILYVKLENPEAYIDRQTGFFNNNALFEYWKELHGKGSSFTAICITFEDLSNLDVYQEESDIIHLEIVSYLSGINNSIAFRKSDDEIVLIFSEKIDSDEKIHIMKKRCNEGWGKNQLILHTGWTSIDDGVIIHDGNELAQVIRYARINEGALLGGYDVKITEDTLEQLRRKKVVEQLILDGMENDRITVFYQPIYSTKEEKFTCAEALVRIYDDNGHLVPPGEFIEIAENNGMIMRLGKIVFEKVCQMISEKDPHRYGLRYIEVNLSAIQCSYDKLADEFIEIMKKYNVPPEYINFEITESASLNAKRTLLKNMKQLIDYGVSFSLDDFGTGQSNLNYIMDMPVEIVKFDMQMSQAYFKSEKSRFIMEAAIAMVHGMGLEIVTEGIEEKIQLDTMEQLGVHYIQGYYFSKPLPEQDFLNFLQCR